MNPIMKVHHNLLNLMVLKKKITIREETLYLLDIPKCNKKNMFTHVFYPVQLISQSKLKYT